MLRRFLLTCTFIILASASTTPALAATPEQTCIEVLTEFGLPTDGCAPPAKIVAKPLPSAPIGKLPARILESHVFFPKGGADLDRDAMVKLAQMIQILQTGPMQGACLRLIGHSDTSGSATVNKDISMKRAEAVADFLRSNLTEPTRVREIAAMGEEQPLENWPETNRMNRRVAIWARQCP